MAHETINKGFKWGSNKPTEYRLAKKANGSICLVGAFEWSGYDNDGNACGGIEWRELPMIELPVDDHAR